ncbi:MAG: NAD(P)/FAD-dependent oxidoreductase [Comamonadaceae bacterium]|nr:MAG: NAD(P)/FAD-dependent oxidoreductase [Comamonadaceae bacterium]
MTAPLDCVVVGGGPAGLTAGVYLARYRRRVEVVDAGDSRAGWIPRTRNVPGYPDGIRGTDLLDRLREHAARYDVVPERGRVESLACDGDAFTVTLDGGRVLRARKVLLATGARDVEPDLPGLRESLATGNVRYCPVCDGFETEGQRVAVLGTGLHGLRESLFVAGFANHTTWLAMGSQESVPAQDLARLRRHEVLIADQLPQRIECRPNEGVEVEMVDGRLLTFDVLYPALGLRHVSGLATVLGADVCPNGQLRVDDHLQTTVPGLYAAGDVAAGLNQIAVAYGQAAIAATAIHNSL